jgi:hypothetical protein
MHHPPRNVRLRIINLERQDLFWTLLIQIVPFMPIRRFDLNSFKLSLGIDNPEGNEIGIWDTVCSCNTKGIFADGLERTPSVDDLKAVFEKVFGFVGQKKSCATGGVRVGVVDVCTVCRCGEDLPYM